MTAQRPDRAGQQERPERPARPHADRGASFETLLDSPAPAAHARGGDLPPGLRRYGDRLAVTLRPERPTVIVNFVESLDGVVTLDPEHGSGGEVSGFSEPDRFVMGLLRSLADIVVVGAGTVRAAPNHAWTPRNVNRGYAEDYARWRASLHLSEEPATMIITASGDIPPNHPALAVPGVPVFVVTTSAGAAHARRTLPSHVRITDVGDGPTVGAAAVLDAIRTEGARLVLCEGGPHLVSSFVAAGLVDELFLTLAPQLLGRRERQRRFGLVEGLAFDAEAAPWGRLRSVRRASDHLFLRYAFGATDESPSADGSQVEHRSPVDQPDPE